MTLATRCTACGTSFRVVQDQLKVSGGWVRCGRCNEVFNALEGLYEIFTQPGEQGADSASGGAGDARGTPPGSVIGAATPTQPPLDSAAGTSTVPDESAVGAARVGAPHDASHAPGQEVHAAPTSALETSQTHPGTATEPAPWDEASAAGFEDVETRLEPRVGEDLGPMPSFMQASAAQRNELSGRQRFTWRLALAGLCVLLATQLALAARDTLAAKLPGLRPVLSAACALAGCRIEPPRNMAALAVEGSHLRQRPGDSVYELVVALRNRSASTVMMPAFELTLTDSQGQALIRRVLSGAEMGAADSHLRPGAEMSLQATLEVSDRRIAGYTVEIFYP